MLGRNDVVSLVNRELLKVFAVADMQIQKGPWREIFDELSSALWRDTMNSLHASGRFEEYGSGQETPLGNVWQGANVTVTPVKFGERRAFDVETVDEVNAAVGIHIPEAANNWAEAYENMRNIYCANYIRNNDTAGYDGEFLFSDSHPQRSRTLDGGPYDNNLGTSGNVTHELVRGLIVNLQDTIAYGENGERIVNPCTHVASGDWAVYMELVTILQSTQRTGTANNDINVLSKLGVMPIYWPQVKEASGTKYLYAFRAKRGLIWANKKDLRLRAWDENRTESIEASATASGAPFHRDWRSASRQAHNALT